MAESNEEVHIQVEMHDDRVFVIPVPAQWWQRLTEEERLIFAVRVQEIYREGGFRV